MDLTVTVVFGCVYLGLAAGKIPGLGLDRTGVALVGAIALVALGDLTVESAWQSVDVETIGLLFGLMVVSAQLRLGGFYAVITRRVASAGVGPRSLLAVVIVVVATLSAILSNDVVCLATTPLLIEACARRGLDSRPFLLGVACSANVGSAATLIGNPQNILIAQRLDMSFNSYLAIAAVPVAFGLLVVWLVIVAAVRDRWSTDPMVAASAEAQSFDPFESTRGLVVTAFILAAFAVTSWPREVVALGAAGVLLMNRRLHSREMLGLVDWQLLVLFFSLFAINEAVAHSGLLDRVVQGAGAAGIDLRDPHHLFVVTPVLSNLVSNVPAAMLLLPSATHPMAGPILALSSTLAGNLLIVGSIANMIVVAQAQACGVAIDWRSHARVGVPVTLLSLAFAAFWLFVVV